MLWADDPVRDEIVFVSLFFQAGVIEIEFAPYPCTFQKNTAGGGQGMQQHIPLGSDPPGVQPGAGGAPQIQGAQTRVAQLNFTIHVAADEA